MARIKKNSIYSFKVKPSAANVLKPGTYVMRIENVDIIYANGEVKIAYLLADGTNYNGRYSLKKRNGSDNDFIIRLLADIATQALNSAEDITMLTPDILKSCEGHYIEAEIINREYNGRMYDLFKNECIYPASGYPESTGTEAAQPLAAHNNAAA